MPYRDLQHFIEILEQKGKLKRIKTEVSQDLEIAEITDRASKLGGPALLFENVKGHSMPVAINLFGTRDRMALALDVDSLEQLPERLGSILALAMNPPTGGFLEKIKALPKLMEMASFMPKSVSRSGATPPCASPRRCRCRPTWTSASSRASSGRRAPGSRNARRSTSRCPRTRRSSSKARSIRTSGAAKAPSGTTPAITRSR